MDILTRPEAREKGLKTYYTGKPCRNGHDSYRYTQSGTCAQCVKAANNVVVDPVAAVRKAAKERMLMVKIRGFMEDRDALAAAAYCLAATHEPQLTQGDVDPRLLPQGKEPAGTALFSFMCFDEDVGTLRQIADGMLKAHPFDVEAARAKAIKESAKWAQ